MQAQVQKQILRELRMTKFNCNYVQAQNYIRNTLKECIQVHIENEAALPHAQTAYDPDVQEDVTVMRFGVRRQLQSTDDQRFEALLALQKEIQSFLGDSADHLSDNDQDTAST